MGDDRLAPRRADEGVHRVLGIHQHDVGAVPDLEPVRRQPDEGRRAACRDLDDPVQILVADDAGRARVLPGDAEEVTGAVRAPQVADAVGAESEGDPCLVEFV